MKNKIFKNELVRDAQFCIRSLCSRTKLAGFSYIEAIISVFILAVGIVAVFSLMSSSLNHTFEARNHESAVLLSQEGIELARNIRDNNWADDADSFANFPSSDEYYCIVDINSDEIKGSECIETNTRLYLDGNNFYVHNSSGTATRFKRQIIIDFVNADFMKITSAVSWGLSWPIAIDDSGCNTVSRCAFSSVTLSRWGE